MAQRVPFIVTALGRNVDPFMLHIYAALAQKGDLISDAPSPAWRRPKSAARKRQPAMADANKAAAAARDASLEPVLRELGGRPLSRDRHGADQPRNCGPARWGVERDDGHAGDETARHRQPHQRSIITRSMLVF